MTPHPNLEPVIEDQGRRDDLLLKEQTGWSMEWHIWREGMDVQAESWLYCMDLHAIDQMGKGTPQERPPGRVNQLENQRGQEGCSERWSRNQGEQSDSMGPPQGHDSAPR